MDARQAGHDHRHTPRSATGLPAGARPPRRDAAGLRRRGERPHRTGGPRRHDPRARGVSAPSGRPHRRTGAQLARVASGGMDRAGRTRRTTAAREPSALGRRRRGSRARCDRARARVHPRRLADRSPLRMAVRRRHRRPRRRRGRLRRVAGRSGLGRQTGAARRLADRGVRRRPGRRCAGEGWRASRACRRWAPPGADQRVPRPVRHRHTGPSGPDPLRHRSCRRSRRRRRPCRARDRRPCGRGGRRGRCGAPAPGRCGRRTGDDGPRRRARRPCLVHPLANRRGCRRRASQRQRRKRDGRVRGPRHPLDLPRRPGGAVTGRAPGDRTSATRRCRQGGSPWFCRPVPEPVRAAGCPCGADLRRSSQRVRASDAVPSRPSR